MLIETHHCDAYTPYLKPTAIIDSDHPSIRAHAARAGGKTRDSIDCAVRLYLSVRDDIWYDPYAPFHLPLHYRASFVLERRRGFCIPKASLLCALARARNIPARLGFANVRNHLATRQLLDYLGSDLFVYHAFVELYLEGKWVKATPAFNRELCERHKVPPLEFNGRDDSIFQPYNEQNRKYMEYMQFLESCADVPVARILAAWEATYGRERVQSWIRDQENVVRKEAPDFKREDVYRD
jgi:transglutaminase-like putative cysteine protease